MDGYVLRGRPRGARPPPRRADLDGRDPRAVGQRGARRDPRVRAQPRGADRRGPVPRPAVRDPARVPEGDPRLRAGDGAARGEPAPAREARRARPDVGGARARAQQPGGGRQADARRRSRDALDTLDGAMAAFVDAGVERDRRRASSSPSSARRTSARGTATARDGLDAADAEDAIGDWLEAHDVPDAWTLAEPLASAGLDAEWLDRAAAARRRRDARSPCAGWRRRSTRARSPTTCATRPTGCRTSSRRSRPTPTWTRPTCRRSTSTTGSTRR